MTKILVDAEDMWLLEAFCWTLTNEGYARYRYRDTAGAIHDVLLHRVILGLIGGEQVTDHINGIPWDNRRCNLRACSRAENARNRRTLRWHSQMKGIKAEKTEHYAVSIGASGEQRYVGTYDTAAEAAAAYDAAARELHGAFARPNCSTKVPGKPWARRGFAGACNGNARLCEEDVRFIQASDATSAALARKFGVTHPTIRYVRAGVTWKHVK